MALSLFHSYFWDIFNSVFSSTSQENETESEAKMKWFEQSHCATMCVCACVFWTLSLCISTYERIKKKKRNAKWLDIGNDHFISWSWSWRWKTRNTARAKKDERRRREWSDDEDGEREKENGKKISAACVVHSAVILLSCLKSFHSPECEALFSPLRWINYFNRLQCTHLS